MNDWSKNFELQYWTAHPDNFYLEHVMEKYNYFDVNKVCSHHFKRNAPTIAIDIGGGALGGALYWYNKAECSFLVDSLSNEFTAMGKLPNHVLAVKNDFATLSFPDNFIDVIFAWEVYDHSLSEEHFNMGIKELCRVLKKNGLLFLQHVHRKSPRRGHTVIINPEQICEWLELDLMWYKEDNRDDGSVRSYFIFTRY